MTTIDKETVDDDDGKRVGMAFANRKKSPRRRGFSL